MSWEARSIHTWSLVGVTLSLILQKKALLSFERPEIFTQRSITSQKSTVLATSLWEPRISCNKSVVYLTGPATAPVTSQREFCANFVTPEVLNRNACRLRLKCDGTRAETRFRVSAKRTSPFKSAGASVQSTTGSRGVRISGVNAGYTMFRGSVKSTGYPLHSQVSPSLRLPACAIAFHLDCTTIVGLSYGRFGTVRHRIYL